MKRKWGFAGAVACAAVLTMVGGSATAAQSQKGPPDDRAKDVGVNDPQARFIPGEVLVRFKDDVSGDSRAAVLNEHGAASRKPLPLLRNVELVRLAPGRGVEAAAAALSRRPEVLYAEPNFIARLTATPNDPRFGELWGLHQASDADIDAPAAWDVTTGSANVVAAVVDTGIAYDHPDLSPNMWTNPGETGGGKETNGVDDDGNGRIDDWRGWDFQSSDNDPRDQNGHGTHVAGTIGAKGNNSYGVVGVNWTVQLMNLKVFGATGGATFADIAAAFAYAGAKGAKVVNASLGCLGSTCFSQLLKDSIDGAPNTLYVVAAGNDNNNNDVTPTYPCNFTSANLICVAATQSNDTRASFSNYGATAVDLAAPGHQILSTWLPFDTIMSDGFESNLANWTTGGTNNTWAGTTEAAASGARSATDSPGALYLNNTNSWMRTTSAFSLAGKTGCMAEYAMRLATEQGFDPIWGEASTNAVNWTNLGGWWGSTNGQFFGFDTDLGPFNSQGTVYFRFRLQTDASVQMDGVHIDNFAIRCTGTTYDNDDFNSISGTSMATPHVAGAAALGWAANPAKTVAEMRTAILANVDVLGSLSGLVATSGRLNVQKLVAAVAPPAVMCLGSPATIVGTAAGETLVGTPGDDVIVGRNGDDTLIGGGGNDKLCGEDGLDTADFSSSGVGVTANLAAGTATGQGNDSLNTIERLTGSPLNDTLTGDGGDNILNGTSGNDTLRGGLGNDILNGAGGTADKGDYSQSATGVNANLTTNTATGEGNDMFFEVENLTGSNQVDTLTGNGGVNQLVGFGGNDTLNGQGGADSLLGRLGDDQANGGLGADTADFSQSPAAVIATTTGATGEGTDTFTGIENLAGSPLNDTLTGDAGVNALVGAGGNDTLTGGANADTLRGRAGDDTLDGGLGADVGDYTQAPAGVTVNLSVAGPQATGSDGTDTLVSIEHLGGSPFNDTLTGADVVANILSGNGGVDVLDGKSGNDNLRGGPGNDNLTGGLGTDVADYSLAAAGITANLNTNTATGDGTDTLNPGIEWLFGSNHIDDLTGNGNPNRIEGRNGNDNIKGLAGNDILIGGLGTDTLDGGDGPTDNCDGETESNCEV